MAIVSGMHQKLLVGTVFAAVSTLLFYATGVDWSWAWDTQNIWPVAIAYFMAACFGVLPYGLLAALLVRLQSSPFYQATSFLLVIALSVGAFSWWRLQDINTAGWDFLLVPVWQATLITVLYGASSLASKRRRVGHDA